MRKSRAIACTVLSLLILQGPLSLAAFGGCMVPIEFFSPTLHTVAFATPHGWAADGFAALTRRGGDILTVMPHLGVLLGFATVLFALGAWRLRRVVTA